MLSSAPPKLQLENGSKTLKSGPFGQSDGGKFFRNFLQNSPKMCHFYMVRNSRKKFPYMPPLSPFPSKIPLRDLSKIEEISFRDALLRKVRFRNFLAKCHFFTFLAIFGDFWPKYQKNEIFDISYSLEVVGETVTFMHSSSRSRRKRQNRILSVHF